MCSAAQRMASAVVVIVCVLADRAEGCGAAEPAAEGGTLILDGSSGWRAHIVWAPFWGRPKGAFQSVFPSENWTQPDFDDSGWMRWRLPGVAQTLKVNKARDAPKSTKLQEWEDTGVRLYDYYQYGIFQLRPAEVPLRCFRGRFAVTDPGKVENLALSLEFRGGVVVRLNGAEVGRAYLPKEGPVTFETLADDYPDEAYLRPDGKDWLASQSNPSVIFDFSSLIPEDPELLKRFNSRIRKLDLNSSLDDFTLPFCTAGGGAGARRPVDVD